MGFRDKKISEMPFASPITGSEKLHVVQDAINKQSTVNKIIERATTTASWGSITGTLSDQTDLQAALNAKVSDGDPITELSETATAKIMTGDERTKLAGLDATDYATAAQGAKADTAVQPEFLSTVATSGNYNDLSNRPSLGSAAATDSSDYATAAQGAKADTATQYSDETANFTGSLQQNGDPVVTQKLLDSRLYQEEMFILGF